MSHVGMSRMGPEIFIPEPQFTHKYMKGCVWSECVWNGSGLQKYLFWSLTNTWKSVHRVSVPRMGLDSGDICSRASIYTGIHGKDCMKWGMSGMGPEIFIPEPQSTHKYIKWYVWSECV
jgi:hypothetical protein